MNIRQQNAKKNSININKKSTSPLSNEPKMNIVRCL